MSPLPSSCRSPEESVLRPIIFLDFDDVICLNKHYGGFDVFSPDPPEDLSARVKIVVASFMQPMAV